MRLGKNDKKTDLVWCHRLEDARVVWTFVDPKKLPKDETAMECFMRIHGRIGDFGNRADRTKALRDPDSEYSRWLTRASEEWKKYACSKAQMLRQPGQSGGEVYLPSRCEVCCLCMLCKEVHFSHCPQGECEMDDVIEPPEQDGTRKVFALLIGDDERESVE
jgi:hypothetical protein